MQAIEIPDKTDRELHIILKRPPPDPKESEYVTKEMFLRFSNIMTNGLQEIVNKMSSIEGLLTRIADNSKGSNESSAQSQPREQQSATSKRKDYPGTIVIHQENYSPEELAVVGLEDEEYEVDVEEYNNHDSVETPEVTKCMTPTLTEDRTNYRKAPPAKKMKKDPVYVHRIQNVVKPADEENNQATENSLKLQDPLKEETIIVSENSQNMEMPQIVNDPQYEIVPVQEESEFDLPLTTLEALQQLNAELTKNPRARLAMRHKLTEISSVNDQNFQKSLSCIIADNVMHQMNWQGLKGKHRMKDMILFTKIMYETWFSHIEFEQFEEQLKFITKKAHKRYAKCMERKRHRLLGGPERLVKYLQSDIVVSQEYPSGSSVMEIETIKQEQT